MTCGLETRHNNGGSMNICPKVARPGLDAERRAPSRSDGIEP